MRPLLLTGIAALVWMSSAQGGIITASSVTAGTTSVDLGFAIISTPTSTFAISSQGGFNGIGVAGGAHATQVDGDEKILINFPVGLGLDEIVIGFLYHTGAAGDVVDERMEIRANGSLVGVLTAAGATFATWTGSGSVTNLSPSGNGSGAVWRISGPFGNTVITSLELIPLPYNAPVLISDSDFALVSLTATPEPSAALLMGLGLVTLGLRRRK